MQTFKYNKELAKSNKVYGSIGQMMLIWLVFIVVMMGFAIYLAETDSATPLIVVAVLFVFSMQRTIYVGQVTFGARMVGFVLDEYGELWRVQYTKETNHPYSELSKNIDGTVQALDIAGNDQLLYASVERSREGGIHWNWFWGGTEKVTYLLAVKPLKKNKKYLWIEYDNLKGKRKRIKVCRSYEGLEMYLEA